MTDDGVTVSRERREAPVGSVQLVSAAILTRLWVKTPCPHQVRNTVASETTWLSWRTIAQILRYPHAG